MADASRVTHPRRVALRARLVADGGAGLSDTELLAVVLDGGGPAGLGLAAQLLATAGGLTRLERLDPKAPPLDLRRTARLRASLELGRRAAARALVVGAPVRDAAAIHAHFRGRLPQLAREVFHVLLLDGRNRLQAEVRVAEGSLTAAIVHPREVFAPALRAAAAALVLVHNHPSGDPAPSAEDVALTERLRRVGDLVGVRVLDHVVIGQGGFVSMAEAERW